MSIATLTFDFVFFAVSDNTGMVIPQRHALLYPLRIEIQLLIHIGSPAVYTASCYDGTIVHSATY